MSMCVRCSNGTAFKRAVDRGHADPPLRVFCQKMDRFVPPDVVECSDFVERYLPIFHGGQNQEGSYSRGLIVDPREAPREQYL